MFFWLIGKQDGRLSLWLAETCSTSSLKPLNGIHRNLTGNKISTSSTKFVFFWADRKNKMAAPASDWLKHFRLLLWNRWTEFDETWQETRSQRLLPKNDGRYGPWLAETFLTSPLKLLNGFQRNFTWGKISTSSTKLCFSVWWVNKNYRPGRSVKKVVHCTQVHDIWPFGPLVYVFI